MTSDQDPNARLVTRDPEAMEKTLEDAEYAGADPLTELDSGLIEVRAGNTGIVTLPENPAVAADQNPNYTPPSQMVSPHSREGAADLPEGAPAEQELDQDGMGR
ncbi:hypothetical protein [Deinococcus aquiradiocola]|uniref:Uncharacterized protein n=1 Tax=Deinococcus aquiradiocola TaxID=393059 RepID=A0A917UPF4_9DEIO|nr:hypothetical protein [Deinococcus aquiradiocola]GGJ72232.1 hypothetical protein GCM10008939_15770 [Deinococcus aquiradiocola]